MSPIVTTLEKGIARITLNRPEKLNALNAELLGELDAAFEGLKQEPELRVVLVQGAGERAFAAGADLGGVRDRGANTTAEVSQRVHGIFRRIETFPRPVIAVLQGWTLGGGLELALACHLRVASEDARLGFPEVGLGLLPSYGGSQRLPRLIGRGPALHLLLTGEPIRAEEALRMGLVSEVCPREDLEARSLRLAQVLASRAPLAQAAVLRAVREGTERSLEEGLTLELELAASLEGTQDRKEGLQAFRERRRPVFTGR